MPNSNYRPDLMGSVTLEPGGSSTVPATPKLQMPLISPTRPVTHIRRTSYSSAFRVRIVWWSLMSAAAMPISSMPMSRSAHEKVLSFKLLSHETRLTTPCCLPSRANSHFDWQARPEDYSVEFHLVPKAWSSKPVAVSDLFRYTRNDTVDADQDQSVERAFNDQHVD